MGAFPIMQQGGENLPCLPLRSPQVPVPSEPLATVVVTLRVHLMGQPMWSDIILHVSVRVFMGETNI